MFVDVMDEDRLARGVSVALDMLVDDRLCTVIVIGVHADGRGIKSWSGGDERVADQVREQLLKALPLTPSSLPRPREQEDGA